MSSSVMPTQDVAVLGGGAAGLFAALSAAQRGRRVLLLEKNRRCGVKILISGGTRCNLTNARGLRGLDEVSGGVDPGFDTRLCQGSRAIRDGFGPQGRFLEPALRRFSVEDSVRFFESAGVATKVEANGKIFPASDRALDVLEALVRAVREAGVELVTHCAVDRVEAWEGLFQITAGDQQWLARRVVLATGGRSYPGCGTTGDGYRIAEALGHTIVPARPALVPIQTNASWVKSLMGITLPDVLVRVRDEGEALLAERRESLLFAHFGLTGPAPLDVSRAVSRAADAHQLRLELDLVPSRRATDLDAAIQAQCRTGRPAVAGLLGLPRRLAEVVLADANVPVDRVGPELSRHERLAVVSRLKGLVLPVAGTLGFEKAEVTSGGVALEEVNPATLESRTMPGLHLCGEVLDLDGRIGGYNFQAAWSTGFLAGASV